MTISATSPETTLSTKIINGLLAIKPLAEFAKNRARNMIIKRAYSIGVNWQENINSLQNHDWEQEINSLTNANISYPEYYLNSFHAYEKGNLQWEAAWELESAAYSVHSTIYSKTPQKEGDRTLRNNYHQVLKEKLAITPQKPDWNWDQVIESIIDFWLHQEKEIEKWRSSFTKTKEEILIIGRIANVNLLRRDFDSLI